LCQADLPMKTSAAATSYILGLPAALQTAVKADSLPSLASRDAVRLLIQQTVARQQQSFTESVRRLPISTSPIECRLYEEVCAHVSKVLIRSQQISLNTQRLFETLFNQRQIQPGCNKFDFSFLS